jgi:hypothetical protein
MFASVSRIAGQVLAPTLVAYGLFLLGLWAGSRTPTVRTPPSEPPANLTDWGQLVRFLVMTAVGGYVVFLALVLIFYSALGGQGPGFVADSFGAGAMLAFAVVVPSFLAMELARALVRKRRR